MAIFNGLFLLAAILVKPDVGSIGHAFAAFSPFPRGSLNTLLLLIASTIGATVTPWMIFCQQSASADKGMTPSDVKHGRLPPSEPGWAPSSAAGPSSPGRRWANRRSTNAIGISVTAFVGLCVSNLRHRLLIAALWALRVFVTIVSLMVIYTFAQHLYQPMRGVCTDSFTSITLPDENAHQQTS